MPSTVVVRCLLVLLTVLLAGTAGLPPTTVASRATLATAASDGDGAPGTLRYVAPVHGEVLRGFEPPGSTYGPGHRGVDLDAEPGSEVHAVATGVVVHAGPVAGTTWVSIDHPDGIRTAYGPLARPTVTVGRPIGAGEVIGTLADGGHGHHGRDQGLHVSARRGGDYLDPRLLWGGAVRPSLVGPGTSSPPVLGGASTWPRASGTGEGATTAAPSPLRQRLARPGPPVPASAARTALAPGGRWTP